MKIINNLMEPSRRSIWLSIFRVYVSVHIIAKGMMALPYLDVLYGSGSFAEWTEVPLYGFFHPAWVRDHFRLVCGGYMAIALLVAFGVGRRWSILALAFLTLILQQINGWVLDGGDNLLSFALIYLSMCDSFKYLALRVNRSRPDGELNLSNFWTNVGVFNLITHLCLIYFISGLSKAHSEVWYNGTAAYFTLVSERFMGTGLNKHIVQNAWIVTMATYGTIFWEFGFSALVWIRGCRTITLAIGVIMHCSIFVFMMIQEFQILFIMMYGFFYTDQELRRVGAWSLGLGRYFRKRTYVHLQVERDHKI